MNRAIRHDEPWHRLASWVPLAVVLAFGSLAGFFRVLEHMPRTPPRSTLVDVRIVEMPPAAETGVVAQQAAHRPEPVPKRKPQPVVPAPRPIEPEVPMPSEPTQAPASEPAPPVPSVALPTTPAPSVTPRSNDIASGASSGIVTAPRTDSSSQSGETNTASLPPSRTIQGSPDGSQLGGGKMGARAIYKPLPEIPEALRRQNFETVAIARFRVAANGSANVELVQPTSDADLNRALLDSLKRWRFFPGMQDGRPVASTIDIRIPISVR